MCIRDRAEAGAMAVERGCQAGVEAAKRADCDAEDVHLGVDVFSGHADAAGFLEDLGVVDGADSCVLIDRLASDDLPAGFLVDEGKNCLLYTSPSPRDRTRSRM